MDLFINEHGYCSKCGTPLEVDFHSKWVENTSALGPAGEWIDEVYCPRCREEEESEKRARIEEQERIKREKEEKERRERHSEYLKRLEKYKKYMPKKVTAIVLTYEEAKYLYNITSEAVFDFTAKKDIKNENLYVAKILKDKLHKAIEDTNYSYSEVGEFAEEKGWESNNDNRW